MILAYPVKNTIFIAFENLIQKGSVIVKDKENNIIKTILFENVDFKKIEMATDFKEVHLDIVADGEKTTKIIYL